MGVEKRCRNRKKKKGTGVGREKGRREGVSVKKIEKKWE